VALADSDGDGASDMYELIVGTNPFDAASHPTDDRTTLAIKDGDLRRLHVGIEGPELVTVNLDLFVKLDLEATPDGVPAVTNELVDPVTGKAFTVDHHGIDPVAAGIDVSSLATMIKADPGSAATVGASTPALPGETPTITRPDDPGQYSEEDPEDPPEPDEEAPEEEPKDDGGDGGDVAGSEKDKDKAKEKDKKAKELNSYEKQQKEREEKAKAAEEAKQDKNAFQKAREKCWFFCGDLTDPDATGGTIDTSNPPAPPIKDQIAPIDVVRDGTEHIEAPNGPPTDPRQDPSVTDPNPDGTDGGATTATPGTLPDTSIAPVDPPHPGTDDPTIPIPGRRP
jgi:hypothetical protein